MARTTPVSNGCTTFVRPVGTILPGAVAMMSMLPNDAQASATQNSAMMVKAMERPTGEGGVSTISSAAGKNASSSRSRRLFGLGNSMTRLADVMDACLQSVQRRVAAAGLDQLVVGPVLGQAPAING